MQKIIKNKVLDIKFIFKTYLKKIENIYVKNISYSKLTFVIQLNELIWFNDLI